MNLENQIQKLDDRLTRLEENQNEVEKQTIANRYELSALIKEAVLEGNKESIKLFEKIDVKFEKKFLELEKRTCDLEGAESKRALEKQKEYWKTLRSVAIGVIVTFFITLVLNNVASILIDNTKKIEEVSYNETIKNFS